MRGTIMKGMAGRVAGAFRIVAFFVVAAWCAPLGAGAAADYEAVLAVYTWEGYFDSELVRQFEEKNNCTVDFTYYDSNETMFEVILEEGSGYDIITPPGNATQALFAAGQILKLDHDLIPNLVNIDSASPALAQDRTMEFSVPYTATVTGIAYSRAAVPAAAAASWNLFADARFAKRMAMLNDQRETLGAALKHLGYSLNTKKPAEIAEAGKLLAAWKKNLALFSVDEAKRELFEGKLVAMQAYNGDIVPEMAENPDLAFTVPAEGSMLNSDQFVIGSDTKVSALAHAFINHFLDAEVAARNMESIGYFMPNAAAVKLLPDALRDNPAFHVGSEYAANCEVVLTLDKEVRELYDEAWGRVLIGD